MTDCNNLNAGAEISAFAPIAAGAPHTLILGTMPGVQSLIRQEYYAHPQNQFWRLMGDLYGAGPELAYEERLRVLTGQGVAVWDVLCRCRREGSMDADIRQGVVNDFPAFFARYPSLSHVVFDSAKAEEIYRRQVLPGLEVALRYSRVPSPSPAHARLRYADKLKAWRTVLQPGDRDGR